jgi:hypothetical protein
MIEREIKVIDDVNFNTYNHNRLATLWINDGIEIEVQGANFGNRIDLTAIEALSLASALINAVKNIEQEHQFKIKK